MSGAASSARAGGRGFVREDARFREWVTADGGSGYAAEPGRYHLYVSLACPWAHRTLIVRALKGLEAAIDVSVVDPIRDERGWAFRDVPGATGDRVHDWSYLSEAYDATAPGYEGRISVPVLWDTRTERIVNNESADIIVMLNEALNAFAAHPEVDLYPAELRGEIDDLNRVVYETVNNGVYRAGFAPTQEDYDEAVHPLFATLGRLDERLASRRYLVGEVPTLADWRLFTTLVRFDAVYACHFKCNLRRIVDYAHLPAYLRDLYQTPGVAETVDMDHIKRHYYETHRGINPTGIVPAGPILDFDAPHGREALG